MLPQNDGGVIVNCGSVHSYVGKAKVAAYAAAKGGVKLFTQPTAVALIGLHPIGRFGTTEEVVRGS